ncbi:DNA-binding protein [Psychrobacter sp. I-STPA10]|uniref:DNA-binding protein n=1 Tax=Psychrobacter sp. I-STPA10 TaxID=2585769 RepID=UPI001E2F81FA|nr:DNA-binding protein [Psychrobacter sp. I-STPA10]
MTTVTRSKSMLTRAEKAEQIKKNLHEQGITIRQWSKQHGYPDTEVYKVLNGERKGLYGRAHEIAVAIGLKSVS